MNRKTSSPSTAIANAGCGSTSSTVVSAIGSVPMLSSETALGRDTTGARAARPRASSPWLSPELQTSMSLLPAVQFGCRHNHRRPERETAEYGRGRERRGRYREPMTCPACGAPVPEGARFCPECGQRLVAAADERRLATVLMADLVGFTALSAGS